MAMEVFPDSPSVGMSPRISFSYDLPQSDVIPVEQCIRTAGAGAGAGAYPTAMDFDFCVFRESFDNELSSADELFFDGKILPIEIKKRLPPQRREKETTSLQLPLPETATDPHPSGKSVPELEEKQKSFWRFKRSSSLNCGSGYGGTLCPLPLLSRSNSTGSTAGGKRPAVSSHQKPYFLKYYTPNNPQKQSHSVYSSRPPLKKNVNGYPGVKVNPVLNIPPAANLFSLGSIFSGGKDKNKKKH